jgi:urea transport system ATP-binding protein
VLALEGVCAGYGQSRVLEAVGISVAEGEAVTLLGRNGVGKTTLLRTIVGLHPAEQGIIKLNNEDITDFPAYKRARKGIGYVPQGRGIFPHLTVEENLRTGFASLQGRGGEKRETIPAYVYELFPLLSRVASRKGGVLSGGEQQQLALARALVAQPRLLILDEPTEGIQPSIVQQIEEALREIRSRLKIAILLVEQYLDFAWSIADRFYVMRGGRILDEGSPREREPGSVVHWLNV